MNPFIDKIVIDNDCQISNPGSNLEINHDVIIEGLESSTDITTGGITSKAYGFTIYGPYTVTIKNLDILGGGIFASPAINDEGTAYVGEGPNLTVENCNINTRYTTTGRNAFYVNNGHVTIKNCNVTMQDVNGNSGNLGGSGVKGNYLATASGGSILVLKEDIEGYKEGIFKGCHPDYSGFSGNNITIQGGKYDKNPTNYVPEGYYAEKPSGSSYWIVQPVQAD